MTETIYCIIHCRVSTGKQAYEGESLETQERICRDIAGRNGWLIAHEPWLEAYSGRKHGREAFRDLLDYLDRNPGKVRYYVFRAIDRFTRGGVLLYARMKQELARRGVELVDSMGVIQPTLNTLAHVDFEYDWSRTSPSEIAEVVMATTAKAEVTTILTRLIGQEIALTQQGYKIRQPQDGFVNERVVIDGKKRTVLAPHPDRARFLIAMFELRAAGQLSDSEIVARVNAMGYRRPTHNRWDPGHTRIVGRSGGGILTVKKFQEIIRRPIYCGIVWEKWTHWKPVRAASPGLVSVETWNAANRGGRHVRETTGGLELLFDLNPSRPKVLNRDNPEYPFRKVVLCPSCRRPFLGSASRGRSGRAFPAYHCDRGHRRVARSKSAFEEALRDYVGCLRFVPDAGILLLHAVLSALKTKQAEIDENQKAIERHLSDLESEKSLTIAAFKAATSDVMRAALEADAMRIEQEIDNAVAQRARPLGITEADLRTFVGEVTEIMEHPPILLETTVSTTIMRARFSRAFEGYPTLNEIEDGTAKLSEFIRPFEAPKGIKSQWVRPAGFTWNQLYSAIKRVSEQST